MPKKTKLYLLVVVCLMAIQTATAQNWGGGVDDDNLHFGFTFQYISSEFKFLKKSNWQDPFLDENGRPVSGKLKSLSAQSSPGFGIGFIVNQRLGEHADLRFTPTLVFNDRLAYYEFEGLEAPIEKKVQSTMIDLPLGIKLKSDRRNNFRAYIIGGAKYSMDIASKKRSNDESFAPMEKFLKNKKNFLSYEAGFGLDLYFEYFKMSPEIKLSYALNSILKDDPSPYSAPIDKLMLRHVTFSLFFE